MEVKQDRGGGPDDAITDKVTRLIRLGAYVETAVAHAGLAKSSHYEWMKRGSRERERRRALEAELEREREEDRNRKRKLRTEERARRKQRTEDDARLRAREDRYVIYADSVERALAEAEMADVAVLAQAAKGGAVIARTTRTRADGSVVSTERLSEPQWTAAAWRLERKHPDRWGRRVVDVSVTGAVATAEVQGAAREKLASILTRFVTRKVADSAANGSNGNGHALEDDDD